MSAIAEVAVLTPGGGARARQRREHASAEASPLVGMAAFVALGLYGVLRWATLLTPAPTWRLIGLLALAAAIAGLAPVAARGRGSRLIAIGAAAIAILAALPLAGIPLTWVLHLRVAVTANVVGAGLGGLPRVLVPYAGINEWVRVVIILGAGVLLLDAGLMLAFVPRSLGDVRRAGAAMPLIALAVVPSALARPPLPYVQGLLLFALVAAFVWGERVPRHDLGKATLIAGLAGVAAVIAAPGIDRHTPWLSFQGLAGTFSPAHVETFDWNQRYGPLNWPRTGREVLDVQAKRPDYWKASNLDVFNGTGWVQGYAEVGDSIPPPATDAFARWTQTIHVTLRGMRSTDVIAAGVAAPPQDVPGGFVQGLSPGTWSAGTDLGPGDSYRVSTYSPRATPSELARAGNDYSDRVLAGYRAILLPQTERSLQAPAIVFPPFHSKLPAETVRGSIGTDGAAAMGTSPYAHAYALATTLAQRAATPYAYVTSVERYLAHGFSYDENPPRRAYPLESFLFKDRIGYCQQFSGAMALLLRMGGIPARVSAGFATGTYDPPTHSFLVSDLDAHAWVEAWFPRYGWVRFDPTPATAPARSGHGATTRLGPLKGGQAPAAVPRGRRDRAPTPGSAGPARVGGTPTLEILASVLVVLLALILVAIRAGRRRTAVSAGDELLRELERALQRCGRRLAPEVTLAQLEHRFRYSPGAAGYVRAVQLARYAGGEGRPTEAQRRALRAQLGMSLGVSGKVRALWALPPRPARR